MAQYKTISPSRAWQIKQAAEGKCQMCAKPIDAKAKELYPNAFLCFEHIQKRRLRARKRKGYKKWRPGSRGRPPAEIREIYPNYLQVIETFKQKEKERKEEKKKENE